MSNQSDKHHYIPQFYQRGFAAENGDLFALKKDYGSIKKWSTAQILYKKGLHTMTIEQNRTSMIEEFYSGIESEFSNYLKSLRDNIKNPQVLSELFTNEECVKLMKVVVSFQFWRTPSKKKLALEYSSELLTRYDAATAEVKEMLGNDRAFIKLMMKKASKNDSIKVIQFLLLPLLTFDLSGHPGNIKLFASQENLSFFSSDDPVIYNDLDELFSFESLSFPISKEFFLMASKQEIVNFDTNTINTIVMDKANEIVICSSKEQLEEMKSIKLSSTEQRG